IIAFLLNNLNIYKKALITIAMRAFKLTDITILLKHLHYLNDVSIFLYQAM
ncbi:hypothetical protein Q604_UNBC08634G0001, partial [human gut metagenome]